MLLVAVLGGVLSLAGCSMQKTVSGWFSGTPAPSDASAVGQAQVYYAKVDGVRVYSMPTASSKVVGELALHQKVTRYKVDSGYAYVIADATGVTGWVDNSALIPRVSTPSAAKPKPKSKPTPTQPQAEEPSATAIPDTPAAPEPLPPPSAAPAKPTPSGPAPSLFDPY